MTPKIKNMIKSVFVLCMFATISGLLLGLVNKLTYIDPLKESLKKFNTLSGTTASFELLAQDDEDILFFAKSDEEIPVYALLCQGSGGYGGIVEMYVFIKDNRIFKISQGYNDETFFSTVEKANFYEKFYDIDLKEAENFSTAKADLVSGATKTSTAVTNAINNAKNYYVDYISENNLNLTVVNFDLSEYSLVSKVEKDDNNNYYFTASKKIIPQDEEAPIFYITVKIIISADSERVINIIDTTAYSNVKYKYKNNYINKSLSEIENADLTTNATASETGITDIIKQAFNILTVIKGGTI